MPDCASAIFVEPVDSAGHFSEPAAVGDEERAASGECQVIGDGKSIGAASPWSEFVKRSPGDVEPPDALFFQIANCQPFAVRRNRHAENESAGVGDLVDLLAIRANAIDLTGFPTG